MNQGATTPDPIALVLGGGGARAAYQAGVLRYIEEEFPEAVFPIITGVSAGAINAAYLANHTGVEQGAAAGLAKCWFDISSDQVFQEESVLSLSRRLLGMSMVGSLLIRRRLADLTLRVKEGEALLSTGPLRDYLTHQLNSERGVLTGIGENLASGRLIAASITATNYLTGQSVTWVQGRSFEDWQRPNRVGIQADLRLKHVMASSALPLLFPAERIDGAWYGDGGIRLTAPLSPALHLGATSILVISTRYGRSRSEADVPAVQGYPPAAQVIGMLLNAIFLDVLDQDAQNLEAMNNLIRRIPPKRRNGLRPVNLLVLRPSVDLGRLSSEYSPEFKGSLKLLTRGLGTGDTKSPDWLSMLLFDHKYVSLVMEIGWEDARRQKDKIHAFLCGRP